ncbi:MAG: ABC transporter ATP-binding protein [Alphaproteobacteria bacterium MedPE-SWcel]|nr:MAG: ABC transporter ATP-binding protein [Alphaproteobacteria bacterium MedPE-SWcel]
MTQRGASLQVAGLKKAFGPTSVLKGVDFSIEPGMFLTLLGPSGCGKSTALRIIAGLEPADAGTIRVDGQDVTDIPSVQRNIGMVFQNYALFPHMSVQQNILYGLKVRRTPEADRRRALSRVADMMGLGNLLDRRPGQLSGGQQQRVALARALVSQRPLVLMDEPLSNLDAKLRTEIRAEIRELNQRLGLTVVYVTHDQSEALSMSDRILLLNNGSAVQFGSPQDLFNTPATVAAARFIGTPPMNVISGENAPESLGRLSVHGDAKDLLIGVRPEDLSLETGAADTRIEAEITGWEYEGNNTLVKLRTSLGEAVTLSQKRQDMPERGTRVSLGCSLHALRLFRKTDGTALDKP